MSLATDRVRAHTAAAVLRRIDDDTTAGLVQHADAPSEVIAQRLEALDREWDTDQAIELEASLMGLTGLALGTFVRPVLGALPAVVAGAVLLRATTGVYPLLPLFRRLGLRTSKEIARERYALKALRGDFADLAVDGSQHGATAAVREADVAVGAADAAGPFVPTPPPPAAPTRQAPTTTDDGTPQGATAA